MLFLIQLIEGLMLKIDKLLLGKLFKEYLGGKFLYDKE